METNYARKIRAICLDCGDTLVDEGTEVKDADGVTLYADLIPGAAEMVRTLKALGYPLALVADGPPGTFYNVLGQYDLLGLFDALAISGLVGVEKPDPKIFLAAFEQLGIQPGDYGRILMVGNNLSRDIKGANELGLLSVWLDWAPRRPKIPADRSEQPCYTIQQPLDLPGLIRQIEERLE